MIALLTAVARLAPEVISSLARLANLALKGASRDEIVDEAERLAILAAYKRSYRRG